MYDHLLDTFYAAAEEGSFSKAAERLFITTNAVVKQIDRLEAKTGILLFERSHRGICLTAAGRYVFEHARELIRLSDRILSEARAAGNEKKRVIRVGCSIMNPFAYMKKMIAAEPELVEKFHFEFITFEDSREKALPLLRNMGSAFDILVCPYASNQWDENASALHLFDIPMTLSVPVRHPLAVKNALDPEDLRGQTILIPLEGLYEAADAAAEDIVRTYPDIIIERVPERDYSLYSKALERNVLTLSDAAHDNMHPLMMNLKVSWPYRVPFGILHSRNPSESARAFLSEIRDMKAGGTLPPI